MPRIAKYLKYLREIKPIKEYLRDTPKSAKSIKTYLLAMDQFFPYLIQRFKNDIDSLSKFDIKNFEELSESEKNDRKKEWEKSNVNNLIFQEWSKLTPEKKADILVKWVNGNGDDRKNVNLNYMWRIQGLLSKLGRDYEANPKKLPQIGTNGFHLDDDITYEEVLELYEILPNKLKLILKILMYTGLNPIDVIYLTPSDFKRYKHKETGEIYYYLNKERIKTKHKDVKYLILFSNTFIEEIKEYFERKIIKHYKTNIQPAKIKKYLENPHFKVNEKSDKYVIFEGQYSWKEDGKEKIFPTKKSEYISDAIKYHVEKRGLNKELNPSSIRRLCFTRLKEVFSLKDYDIYNIWTQHKAKLLTRHYVIDLLDRMVNYMDKIQETVLIGSVGTLVKKIRNLEENGIKEIERLRVENKELAERLEKQSEEFEIVKQKMEKLDEILTPEIFSAIKREFLKHKEPEEKPKIPEGEIKPDKIKPISSKKVKK